MIDFELLRTEAASHPYPLLFATVSGAHLYGFPSPDSDYDLGIYYDPAHKPSLAALRALAQALDDRHAADLATDFGEWGPWINGGG